MWCSLRFSVSLTVALKAHPQSHQHEKGVIGTPPEPLRQPVEVASLFKKWNLDSKLCVKIFAYSSAVKGTL